MGDSGRHARQLESLAALLLKHLKCRVFCCVVHVRNRALASRRTGILESFAPRCPASAHHYSRSLLLLLLPACLSSCVLACWFVSGSLRSFIFSVFIGLQADQGWYGETGRGPKWSIAEWQRQTVAGLSPHTDRLTEPPHKLSRWPSGKPLPTPWPPPLPPLAFFMACQFCPLAWRASVAIGLCPAFGRGRSLTTCTHVYIYIYIHACVHLSIQPRPP